MEKILLTRKWPQAVEDRLAARYDATFNASDEPLPPAAIHAAMERYDAVLPTVSDRLPGAMFEGVRAKIVGNFGVGVDHIDLAAARRAGIVVTNTPGVLTDATADLALTLILMLTRRAGEGEREVRAGRWTGWRPTHLVGTGLKGRTLGIVGMGRIGRATARRAQGFGMEIVYFNRSPVDDPELGRFAARPLPSVLDVMSAADIVSLHCPGGGANAGLIGERELEALGPRGVLVNTARGDVVDEAALVAALAARTIAGAGLDVYAAEPRVPEALRAMENVVLLPHLGSATAETREAMGMMVADNLDAFFAGEEPFDRVV